MMRTFGIGQKRLGPFVSCQRHNEFHTFSSTRHHRIEVLWPGAVILVRLAPAEEAH